MTVLLELERLLCGFYELPDKDVLSVLRALASIEHITLEVRDPALQTSRCILAEAFRRPQGRHRPPDTALMSTETSLSISQHIVRVCLFLAAAIAVFGGSLQFYLGQPDTSARLDNVHRFMAGIYLSTGLICLWAGLTVRQQGFLVYLLALGILLAGIGRLVSISKVGLPEPKAVWLGYLVPELVLPFVLAGSHYASS